MRYYDTFPPYVPVAQRRAKAAKQLQQMQKNNPNLKPVMLTGNSLASTWWGKSWNSNLERYADYSNRIGRGRSYVRNHAVLDLQITPATITALVQGSRPQPYQITITIGPLSAGNWSRMHQACAGRVDSLGELLAGHFPQALKDLFFEKSAGLFPAPHDIHFDCSCPDWASMCKHVAATLYGVGARLDHDPALFFTLRGINVDDLIAQTVTDTAQALLSKAGRQSQNVLQDVDLGDVFGIQMDDINVPPPDLPPVQPPGTTTKQQATRVKKTAVVRQTTRATKHTATPRRVMQPKAAPVAAPVARPPVSAGRVAQTRVAAAPSKQQSGSMLETLVKAVGKARKGKSIEQLQAKLGWTRTQVRNAMSRANAKGLIEAVSPGMYRQKV